MNDASHRSTNNLCRMKCSIALALVLPFGLLGCPSPSADVTPPVVSASPTPPVSAGVVDANAARTVFDQDRAFTHLRRMVEIGPRPAGSPELAQTRDLIAAELKSYGLSVTIDEFRPRTPIGERRMFNVTAELPGASSDIIIIASHYDTKLYKDVRFVGANDGGSSTAVVMELARVIAANASATKPPFTYRFVFFDGEEAFCGEWSECVNAEPGSKTTSPDNTYGSRRYVAQLTASGELARVRSMLLLDLVGYRSLRFERESNSTQWLTNAIWETARELGYGNVFVSTQDSITDDHTPFLRAGVNAVDIIQLGSYPHWHTPEDTLDKIAPASLKVTGDVVLASLPKIEARLQNTAPKKPLVTNEKDDSKSARP